MKRFLQSFFVCVLLGMGVVYAANVVPTPIVGPTETGENSLGAQQVTDVARIKLGSCTVTTTGSSNANTGTCNGASGAVTTNSISIAVTTGRATVTITNSKIQAGDFVQCTVDSTGATASSTPFCASAQVSANQVVFTLANLGAATETANLTIYFLVMTQGNPN